MAIGLKQRGRWLVACAAAFLGLAALGTAAPQTTQPSLPSASPDGRQRTRLITPVSGPSVLHRLALTVQQSSMGSTGQWGPRPDLPGPFNESPIAVSALSQTVTLSGADLYRLDCRGCHKASGTGAPPEINSLIEPVQGTSLVLWQEQMRRAGRTIDPAFGREVVAGAQGDLLKRLRDGGQKMPAFQHLQTPEVDALVAYLDLLAGVPGAAGRQHTVTESPLGVGEHLVKGTCHTCHDAVGPWPTPEALLDNAIPSLASLMLHKTLEEVVAKVRQGAPVVMGPAHIAYRGRMPVFGYLTDAEVGAAYLYLLTYPPQ